MTIVGDVAQNRRARPAPRPGNGSLAPLAGDRWRLARLTVNYRTPAEIMAATADLLARDSTRDSSRRDSVREDRRAAPGGWPSPATSSP